MNKVKIQNSKFRIQLSMFRIILAVVLSLVLWDQAGAFTVSVNGVSVNAQLSEPSLNADGSQLTDLANTSVYYDIGSGWTKGLDIPATSAAGGGTVSGDMIVPVLEGQEMEVPFATTATDKSGNESVNSQIVTERIDRLAPAPPE